MNQIPFSDHGALLDPPTADVTARCVSMLAQLGERRGEGGALDKAIAYLERTQEKDGSWYGRWGMNYIYGTWSVLCALNAAGLDPTSDVVRKSVDWLVSIQNADGGWGEDGESYRLDYKGYEPAPSTASQTAWALMGLMAAGEVDHPAVTKGVAYLASMQGEDGFWAERALSPQPAFPASSIFAITAMRNFFRCGPWRAIAISKLQTQDPFWSGCSAGAGIGLCDCRDGTCCGSADRRAF